MNQINSYTFLFLIIFSIQSCKKNDEIEKSIPTVSENGIEYYFPVQTDSLELNKYPDQQGKLHPYINEGYSKYLQKMKEPNLSKKQDSGYIIRYTFLPSMILYPETYRIQKNGNDWHLYYKQIELLTTSDSYEPGEILKDTLVEFDWHTFYQLEYKLKEFDLPNRKTHNQIGLDGDMLILEVYKNGDYHFINRWSPREEDEKEFIELTKMIEEIYNEKSH